MPYYTNISKVRTREVRMETILLAQTIPGSIRERLQRGLAIPRVPLIAHPSLGDEIQRILEVQRRDVHGIMWR
jgi:hypothetical protein